MVFFICDVCQETLKKSAVDKHCMRCRDCWYLSCVDCGKVFAGEEYRSHTSCISEAEKYQGALYRGNKKKNGKVDPQEKWMNSVRKAATSSKGSRTIVDMLRYLNNQDNIPRKEKKFMNYLKNSYRQPGAQSEFKKVWDIIYKIHNAFLIFGFFSDFLILLQIFPKFRRVLSEKICKILKIMGKSSRISSFSFSALTSGQ